MIRFMLKSYPRKILCASVAAGLLFGGAPLQTALAAEAELRVFSPVIEEGALEVEINSALSFDKSHALSGQQTHFGEIGYGVTDFWRTEIEGRWDTGDNHRLRFRTLDFENDFALLRHDEHWLDAALAVEYDHAVDGMNPETLQLGGLFQKTIGPSTTSLNVFLGREFGRSAATGTRFTYIGVSTWQVTRLLAPGIEFFGSPGRLGRFDSLDRQDHRLGPILASGLPIGEIGKINLAAGYLFGLTPAAPSGTLIGRLEFDRDF